MTPEPVTLEALTAQRDEARKDLARADETIATTRAKYTEAFREAYLRQSEHPRPIDFLSLEAQRQAIKDACDHLDTEIDVERVRLGNAELDKLRTTSAAIKAERMRRMAIANAMIKVGMRELGRVGMPPSSFANYIERQTGPMAIDGHYIQLLQALRSRAASLHLGDNATDSVVTNNELHADPFNLEANLVADITAVAAVFESLAGDKS